MAETVQISKAVELKGVTYRITDVLENIYNGSSQMKDLKSGGEKALSGLILQIQTLIKNSKLYKHSRCANLATKMGLWIE